MRIAVTYEDGLVFQHFGKTKEFKIYEVDGNEIDNCELITTDGEGHEALAPLLSDYDIDVVICGGLGDGAKNALAEEGIHVISGASGDANQAVKDFLAGNLTSEGVNCNHHEDGGCGSDEGCSCGSDEGCGCGSDEGCGCGSDEGCGCGSNEGCGGCGNGCGGCMDPKSRPIIFEGPNAGKIVSVHYTGTLDDGTKFDSSYDRNEPLQFVCGTGMMIAGFDKAVVEMAIGETKEIHLLPEEAYGERDPKAILKVEQSEIPGSEKLSIGDHIVLSNSYGQRFPVVVSEKDDTMITFDANHELAGKALNFKIELVSIED